MKAVEGEGEVHMAVPAEWRLREPIHPNEGYVSLSNLMRLDPSWAYPTRCVLIRWTEIFNIVSLSNGSFSISFQKKLRRF